MNYKHHHSSMLVIWGFLNFKNNQSSLKEKAKKEETAQSSRDSPKWLLI